MPPPARAAKRVLLSSYGSAWGRQRVYRTPDALELEESENLRVSVRRVFFDEVLLVTRHREIGWLFLLAMAIGAAYFGFFSLMIGIGGGVLAGLGAFAASTLPFVVAFVLRIALGVDCVTVYGKRTRARLRFWLRKRRAQEVFQLLCRLTAERQERVAREQAAATPAPAEPPPPPLEPAPEDSGPTGA